MNTETNMAIAEAVKDDVVKSEASNENPARLTSRLRWILAIVIIADVLDLMDSTITNLGAPTIVREIGGGEGLIKWLGASYALAMGVLLVVGGRLGDKYGRRNMFLIGIWGFVVASLLCALSFDPTMLIVCRLLQGGFGALLIPQGFGILISTFSREQLPTAFSVFAPVMGGSAVLSPLVAGFLIDANIAGLTWRPMFLLNILLGGFGIYASVKLLPHDEPDPNVSIDGLGAGLLAASMLGIIYGLIEGSTAGWTIVPILSIIAGVMFLVGFAIRQRVATRPLILPSLLGNRGFSVGMLLGLFFFAAISGFTYVVSLFYQTALGLLPSQTALSIIPLMVGLIIASIVGRPLIAKLGRTMIVGGLLITFIAAVGLWATVMIAGINVSVWALAPSNFVLGIGMGACFGSIFDVAIGDIAPEEAGSASGTLNAVQQIANAIGSAVVTTIYFGQVASHGPAQAFTTSIAVVGSITLLCLALVWLLPKSAPQEPTA